VGKINLIALLTRQQNENEFTKKRRIWYSQNNENKNGQTGDAIYKNKVKRTNKKLIRYPNIFYPYNYTTETNKQYIL